MQTKDKAYELLNSTTTGNIHISYSEFSLFGQCAHRHLLEKYLKLVEQQPSIHLFFGNCIHAAIENSLKEGWDANKRVEFFKEKFYKEMSTNMPDTDAFKNDFEDFSEQGANILTILDAKNIFKDYEIVSIEEALYEKLYEKFFFKGFIDLVLRHKITGRILIVDWKTSGEAWEIDKKMKDLIFLCQMRFYKYFWGKKNDVPLENIDCKYIVLNRLKNKKQPKKGFGELQSVFIESTYEEIFESIKLLAESMKKIHIENVFEKIKMKNPAYLACMFCPFRGGSHPLCDSNPTQYIKILKDNKK